MASVDGETLPAKTKSGNRFGAPTARKLSTSGKWKLRQLREKRRLSSTNNDRQNLVENEEMQETTIVPTSLTYGDYVTTSLTEPQSVDPASNFSSGEQSLTSSHQDPDAQCRSKVSLSSSRKLQSASEATTRLPVSLVREDTVIANENASSSTRIQHAADVHRDQDDATVERPRGGLPLIVNAGETSAVNDNDVMLSQDCNQTVTVGQADVIRLLEDTTITRKRKLLRKLRPRRNGAKYSSVTAIQTLPHGNLLPGDQDIRPVILQEPQHNQICEIIGSDPSEPTSTETKKRRSRKKKAKRFAKRTGTTVWRGLRAGGRLIFSGLVMLSKATPVMNLNVADGAAQVWRQWTGSANRT